MSLSTPCSHQSRGGYTLVELLAALVVLAILAAIVVVPADKPRERAHVAAMQSDLHGLVSAQEAYASDHGSYANDPALLDMEFTSGVEVTIEVDTSGWTARAEHAGAPGQECAVAMGEIEPLAPATTSGLIACSEAAGGGGSGCSG